ncbi:MAG: S8 family peptidase [Acidimicrobiales bacterium]
MADDQNTPRDGSESHVIEALKALGRQESAAPDGFTRRRHLKAMERAAAPRRRTLPAVGVAAALILVTAVAVNGGGPGSESPRNAALDSRALREAPELSPVPLERDEDWVILEVSAARAGDVANELRSLTGSAPVVVGSNDDSTTYVVPQSAARSIADTTGITATPDTPVKTVGDPVSQNPVPSWGLDRIDSASLDGSYSYISAGAGVYAYVIDTGVYAGHSDFGGRVRSGYTAISDGNGTGDCNGHGTHVAGTVAGNKYGVAKSATVVAVRVLDCNGSGYVSSVIAGINWVVASHPGGPGVINLSLGGGANSALDAAVESAAAAGLVVAVAAGNSSADACSYSPARAPSALTIGAIDQNDNRAGYSNTGSCVDLWAPGSGITSAGITGSGSSSTLSGTSMASPHVAGLAARMLQARPGISAATIASTLSEPSSVRNPGGTSVVEFAETPDFADPTTTTALETSTVPESSTTVDSVPAPTSTSPAVTTTVPAPTTTVPVTTTVPKKRGNDDKKRNREAPQPKEFQLRFGEGDDRYALTASWTDDGTPESWRVECARLSAGANAPAETTVLVERSSVTVRERRNTAQLAVTPESGMRCWMVSLVGTNVSPRSNQSIVPPAPRRKRDDDKTTTTTVAPTTTTVAPTTTVPVTTTAPAPTTTVAGTSRVTTTVPRAPETTRPTVPPKPTTPPKTTAPKKNP